MGWIAGAVKSKALKLTDHLDCPIHNPKRKMDVETEFIACRLHKWANREWFVERFPKLAWYARS